MWNLCSNDNIFLFLIWIFSSWKCWLCAQLSYWKLSYCIAWEYLKNILVIICLGKYLISPLYINIMALIMKSSWLVVNKWMISICSGFGAVDWGGGWAVWQEKRKEEALEREVNQYLYLINDKYSNIWIHLYYLGYKYLFVSY